MNILKKNYLDFIFYIFVMIDITFFGIIVYLYKNKQLSQYESGILWSVVLGMFFFAVFLFSFIKEEACIHGFITIKKFSNPPLYWFMTSFWAVSAFVCFGYALYSFIFLR